VKLVVIAAAMLLLAIVVASAGAAGQKPGFGVEIITCPDGTTPESGDASDCQSSQQKLPPPKKKGTPDVDQPKPDTTEVNLRPGDQTTSSPGETSLDLNLKARDSEGNLTSEVPDVPAPVSTKPDVTTTGGALGPVGGGSPFDFVSTDEALSSFAIPPFLLPIYVSAGRAYDIPWNVLAAINQIETDFGRIEHQVSSAGAQGWMQFIPSTWEMYGVDASGDGIADPYNPVDAIYAAARYLSACSEDLREAVFCYNHADWYVDEVMANASVYGSLPGGLVTETGSLAFGHFPVRGEVTYGDDFREAQLQGAQPEGLRIDPAGRATAVATQDATVTRVLLSPGLARAFRRDPGRAAARVHTKEAPKPAPELAPAEPESEAADSSSTESPLSAVTPDWVAVPGWVEGLRTVFAPPESDPEELADALRQEPAFQFASAPADPAPAPAESSKDGSKPAADGTDSESAPGNVASGSKVVIAPGSKGLPKGYEVSKDGVGVELTDPVGNHYRYSGLEKLSPELRPGAKIEGGAGLGPLEDKKAMLFAVQAAGGAPVDPRPLVDGYRLQEAADYFHAVEPIGGNPFLPDGDSLAAGVLSGDQAQLSREVLADPGISIYDCGRTDIQQGIVDKRILGAMLYLRRAGLTLTITSLRCGHGYYTAGGSVSAHSYGAAMDIAAFNGQPVIGNQGPGSLTEQAVKLLMQLEGEALPSQLISLMDFGGPSFAMGDHDDHLHVGYNFETTLGLGRSGESADAIKFGGGSTSGGQGLDKPEQTADARQDEQKLSERLGKIENPLVPEGVSPGAPKVAGGRVEGEFRSDAQAAEKDNENGPALELGPTASGAEMRAIDIPAGGGEAYAVGVVDGAAQGWDERQTVILARNDGAWTVVGPPRDAQGKVANPKLLELATVSGGRGYAVGKGGSVVELRGSQAPREVRSGTTADLRDVDVEGGTGYAVGDEGTVLRLQGARATRERTSESSANLTGVTLDGDEPVAAGTGAVGRPSIFTRDGSGSWQSSPADLGTPSDAAIEIEDIDASGNEVWVVGSFADSAATPLQVPFAAQRGGGGGWTTYCSPNPAQSIVQELGDETPGPCDNFLPSSTAGTSASAVAITGDHAIVAAGAVLTPLGGQPLGPAAAPEPIDDLAADSRNEGLALGLNGRLVQFGSGAAATPQTLRSADLPLGNARPVQVASAGPDDAIAFGGGRTAELSGDTWELGVPTGLAVRDAAWYGNDMVWAVDELGSPIAENDGEWAGPGDDRADVALRQQLAEQIGGLPLTTPGSEQPGDGLRALAFAPSGVGFAVGGDLIGTFDRVRGWSYTTSDSSLNDVAAGPGGAIAVGDGGTLLERDGEDWNSVGEANELSGGGDLTAAGTAQDGTLLAAGGGVVLSNADGEWSALDLPALGVEVRRLAAVSGDGDQTVVFALVDSGGELVLLRGADGAWSPVTMPEDVTLSDMAAVPGTSTLLLGGDRSGRAVAMQLDGGSDDSGQAPDGAGEGEADGRGARGGLKDDHGE
jgi:hypothetical protein